MLSALETFKSRLNAAFAARSIDKGYYQDVRRDTASIEQTLRDFALHHERSYNRSVGFVERMEQQRSGMLHKGGRDV
ncbi:hypothetical protein [Paenibacillus sp. CGMCC 1.18879]|uniref:hypothetical protein n=1 Tax=Paenibacillus sp. CGMCC 1.18879 TaxID=2834466 RepID=UPI001CA881E0|nr:hypothetical protein [Paenibacillus sp. CGMCC 1.18879]MBY9082627.1 hypothetical protein [Paenibacillus sp. CGMCC 1.18879]